jgi:hypothetical protein
MPAKPYAMPFAPHVCRQRACITGAYRLFSVHVAIVRTALNGSSAGTHVVVPADDVLRSSPPKAAVGPSALAEEQTPG